MHSEKINEIVAHFIGLFNTAIDDARIRFEYLQGYETRRLCKRKIPTTYNRLISGLTSR